MMASILRVIPHALYDKLLAEGVIQRELSSEETKADENLFQKVPITLQSRAKEIVNDLVQSKDVEWNADFEVGIENNFVPSSDIRTLLKYFVLENPIFYELPGAELITRALPSVEKVKTYRYPAINIATTSESHDAACSWITFEEKFY
jgi:hypothetical protein